MDAHLDPHPPYHGGPNIEFFTSPESMQGFEVIQQWLKYFCRTVSIRWLGELFVNNKIYFVTKYALY